ncbi:MAG: sensor domain-containing diguanylate cyclase [Fimbriimonadaceae bacterium]|nr:sensor domain-containing diguanylate cyclase [Fimbriimonadaceae bacterium]
MRLQNLYNSEAWAVLSSLYRAVAIVHRDGRVLLSGGEFGKNLSTFLETLDEPYLNKLGRGLSGEAIEFLHDINRSDLPELLKLKPLEGEDGKVEAVLVTAEDAPAEMLRQTDVQARLNEYEFIIRNIRQGIWQLDDTGIVVECNPYLAQWLEYEESEVIGAHASQFMVGTDLKSVTARETCANFEAEFLTKSGIRRNALVSTCPTLNSEGHVAGTIDIITDITAEHALHSRLVSEVQKMAKLASIDALTGAANRLTFDTVLENLTEEAEKAPFGVVAIDLDFFKQVNDTYGHPAGDRVLVEVVNKLEQLVRSSDIVARLGGDEFVVLLADATPERTEQIAKRLRDRLQFYLPVDGNKIPVHVSVGWAHSSEGVADIVSRADRMLYEGKRKSRDGHSIADLAGWIDKRPEIL